jgi:hypothetical protein
MSNRTHKKRYEHVPWSPKSAHGPMPKWLKRFQHRLQRQLDRKTLMAEEEHWEYKKGRVQWMWY